MRQSLLHPLVDKRHRRRQRDGRIVFSKHKPAAPPSDLPATEDSTENATEDFTAQRVREAGGPLDEACYPCSCGYFFIAPVSTSVACPHCGITQAW